MPEDDESMYSDSDSGDEHAGVVLFTSRMNNLWKKQGSKDWFTYRLSLNRINPSTNDNAAEHEDYFMISVSFDANQYRWGVSEQIENPHEKEERNQHQPEKRLRYVLGHTPIQRVLFFLDERGVAELVLKVLNFVGICASQMEHLSISTSLIDLHEGFAIKKSDEMILSWMKRLSDEDIQARATTT